jgi:hypothetical protein
MFNKHWSAGKIAPISLVNNKGQLKQKNVVPFFTIDIETINYNNVQLPIAISSCGSVNGFLESKIFLIDNFTLEYNTELALYNLWKQYFKYLENLILNSETIFYYLTNFAHNLGEFYGYFYIKVY